jgi:hypothetical protein
MLKRLLILSVLLVLISFSVSATSILISQSSGNVGYGYGFSQWTNFTNALDTASGNGVDVVSDFTNLGQMLTYDALLLDQRWTSGSLLAGEAANVASFIATGRCVLMMGENDSWTSWNNQILAIVGGSYESEYVGNTSSILAHPLTIGVNSVNLPWAGRAVGGTALFDQNFATLWGAGNVLTVLDINVWQDSSWGELDNGIFGTNVVNWLAGKPSDPPITDPIPEPATLTLLGLGMAGMAYRRLRKNT